VVSRDAGDGGILRLKFLQQLMKSSKDIFSRDWLSIVTDAVMHRVQRPPDGVDSLTVTKTTFDDLVSVAEVACGIQHFFRPSAAMTITYQNQEYHVVVKDSVIPTFTVSKPTLLEAISEAQRQVGAEIDKFIR
jgi:hypothetical protein